MVVLAVYIAAAAHCQHTMGGCGVIGVLLLPLNMVRLLLHVRLCVPALMRKLQCVLCLVAEHLSSPAFVARWKWESCNSLQRRQCSQALKSRVSVASTGVLAVNCWAVKL